MHFYRFFFAFIIPGALYAALVSASEPASPKSHACIKCETPYILESYLTGAGKIAQRPQLAESVISEQGHFRVHFDTSVPNAPDQTDTDQNGIPDYVDSTLVYLEYAWDHVVNKLGYPPPLGDNGEGSGDEIDVYIKEYGEGGAYGGTFPANIANGSSSAYIKIDNGFTEPHYPTKGYDALRVTTAHEFFHAVQFRYSFDFLFLRWWMEQTAVWMEDQVWDDVNDYLAYLNYFFDQPMTSLDNNDRMNNYMYGATLWAMYLVKNFNEGIIKDLWQYLGSTGSKSITVFDDVIPGGLAYAFNEFAVWNYFTEERANTNDFHSEADMFRQSVSMDTLGIEDSYPAVDSLTTNHLTSRYVELLFAGSWGEDDVLSIKILPRKEGLFASSLVLFNDPDDYRTHLVDPGGEYIPLLGPWEKAILITSCTNTQGSDYLYAFETEISKSTGTVKQPLYTFTLHGTYPNPFNPSTTIRFSLPEYGHVRVRVFNVRGQKVADLYDGNLEAGEKRILWKPENLAAGVYLVNIATPFGLKTSKLLFLK